MTTPHAHGNGNSNHPFPASTTAPASSRSTSSSNHQDPRLKFSARDPRARALNGSSSSSSSINNNHSNPPPVVVAGNDDADTTSSAAATVLVSAAEHPPRNDASTSTATQALEHPPTEASTTSASTSLPPSLGPQNNHTTDPPQSNPPPESPTTTSAAAAAAAPTNHRPPADLSSSSDEEEFGGPAVKKTKSRRKTIHDDDDDDSLLVDTDDDDNGGDDVPRKRRRVKPSGTKTKDFLVDTDDEEDDEEEDDDDDHQATHTSLSSSPAGKQPHSSLPKLARKPKPAVMSRKRLSPTHNTIMIAHDDDDMLNVRDKKEGDPVGVHDDVEFIDEIEWAPEDDSKHNELANKPRPDPMGDPCGCTLPHDYSASAAADTNHHHTSPPTPTCCVDPSCILFACQEECRSNCEAGPFCGNKRIQRREWKQVQVFHAGPKGRGLRMLENVKKGDFILEYIGRAVRAAYLTKLFQRYKQERRLYIMALDNNVYLDARKKGSVARYINHSCEPNCVVERWKVRGIIRAGIFATRDIQKGEELSFDYQWERKKGRAPTKCYCGTPSCRGTLEVSKSLEELEFEKSYEGHWKPGSKTAAREIINRSIRILSQEHQQYFYADVCKYDDASKKHLVLYRPEWEEVWEDLSREEWQLLDDVDGETQDFVIAKKVKSASYWQTSAASASSSTSQKMQTLVASPNAKHRPGGASLLDKIGAGDRDAVEELRAIKPYVYVQTPIKEAFWAKHLIQRCERNCRVAIVPKQFSKPPLPLDPSDPDDVEKHKALDESLDGTVWKLSVSGYNVAKACTILEKNVAYLTKQQQLGDPSTMVSSSSSLAAKGGNTVSGNAANLTGGAANSLNNAISNDNLQEVVMPRCVVDNFKRRLPFVREKCRSVNISFVHSESKSKQIAKVVLEASLQSDMFVARDSVWSHLNAACAEVNAPKTPNETFYRDLGFMGGELTREQFRLLRQDKYEPDRRSQDCREDLRKSPFFVSFESTQRCTVWVQSEDDKGRIDGSNNIVGEATPDAPRKIYFGCDPKDITKLWTLVQTRASEVARGVRYLYLGADRVYLPFMIQNGAKFFDYVKRVTGASVMVDHMTGDHLRIDGRSYLAIHTAGVIDVDKSSAEAENERVTMAEEMIHLQIEIYRDHCIRRQNWIFGRDWTLSKIATTEFVASDGNTGATKPLASAPTSRLQFDDKTVANSCQEIADITLALGTSGSCGVGAALTFYRFVTMVCQRDDFDTQLKVREIVLACIFLANKAQKVSKWKRLEEVLKAAYQVFYPGASFDGGKEEVLILADKVLLAEAEVLDLLEYDVFWRGTDWILAAAVEAAGFNEAFAADALNVACSGPVLAAGSSLWLKYGVEYVFAAAAGFLQADMDKLFSALSLIPLKVSQAAEIIVDSIKVIPTSKRSSSHRLFDEGKDNLRQQLPRIKEVCVKCMTSVAMGQADMSATSETSQRFRLIGSRDCRRHAIRGVHRSLLKDVILPTVDGTSAESKCNIYIGESAVLDADDIVLEGSWRAVAIAEHLLRATVAKARTHPLPPAIDISVEIDVLNKNKLQAKVKPGLLSMSNVVTGDGWSDTIQSELSGAASWGRKTGGKICVAGKLAASSLREVGLRWWVPPQHGPSPTGSICDMFLIRSDPHDLQGGLQRLARSFSGESGSFPLLACGGKHGEDKMSERFVAVSLQRWPSEKVESRELEKTKKAKKSKRSVGMGMGFSAAALQEMQILNELHSVIPSPQGHPNFILPVAVALPHEDEEEEEVQVEKESEPAASTVADDIFSLFRTSEENEKVARSEKKRRDFVSGPHLVFQPSPFLLQRFMSRKKRKHSDEADSGSGHSIGPAIFSAWFHDLLSALVHCHTNHVVVRSFQADQIIIDHSGVAKLGGLYRATVISSEDRNVSFDPLKFARANNKKDKKDRKSRSADDDDDVTSDPYIAPENLFGCSKRTKESDIWSLGCLLTNVLLNKAIFSGRDRQALLNSIYKVVGTPARDNYEICVKYPFYARPPKKYKRGVEKALQHVLKEESAKHAGAIDLLAKMLHLDPSKRITAVEALRHFYMQDYIENSNSESFRRHFVEDWMLLKGKLMKSSQSDEDKARERERNLKRKAALLEASGGQKNEQDEDDLYNLDELFATDDSKKKPKI